MFFASLAIAAALTSRPPAWTAKTCTAFATWEQHPTTVNLITLGTDSLHVTWKYLGGDVWQLVKDVHDQPKYVSDDEQYVYEDCHNGSGL